MLVKKVMFDGMVYVGVRADNKLVHDSPEGLRMDLQDNGDLLVTYPGANFVLISRSIIRQMELFPRKEMPKDKEIISRAKAAIKK